MDPRLSTPSDLTESEQKELSGLLWNSSAFFNLVNSPDETVLQRLRFLRSLFESQPRSSSVRQRCHQPEHLSPKKWASQQPAHELQYSDISHSHPAQRDVAFPSNTESAKPWTVPAKKQPNFSHGNAPSVAKHTFPRSIEEICGSVPCSVDGLDFPAAAKSDARSATAITNPRLLPFSSHSSVFTAISGYSVSTAGIPFLKTAKPDLQLACIDPECLSQPRGKKGVAQHFRKTHLSDKWLCRHRSCQASEFKTEQALKNHFATHKKRGHYCTLESCSQRQPSPVRLHACPFDLGDEGCYQVFNSKGAFGEHMSGHIQRLSCQDLRKLWSRSNVIKKFLFHGPFYDPWFRLLGGHYGHSGKDCPPFSDFSWSATYDKFILDHLEQMRLPESIGSDEEFAKYIFDTSSQRKFDVFPKLPPRPNPALAWTDDDAVECEPWQLDDHVNHGIVDHTNTGRAEGFPFVRPSLA